MDAADLNKQLSLTLDLRGLLPCAGLGIVIFKTPFASSPQWSTRIDNPGAELNHAKEHSRNFVRVRLYFLFSPAAFVFFASLILVLLSRPRSADRFSSLLAADRQHIVLQRDFHVLAPRSPVSSAVISISCPSSRPSTFGTLFPRRHRRRIRELGRRV